MNTAKPTVLILCTGNSCRSHLAEGILRAVAGDILDVQSAGSKPAGYIHPLAIAALKEIDIDISAHRSKAMTEFMDKKVETVITVCGNAAGEACPVFMGAPLKAHWGLPDPADVNGTEAEVDAAFEQTWHRLEQRVRALLDLPFETMERETLAKELARIGQMEGAA